MTRLLLVVNLIAFSVLIYMVKMETYRFDYQSNNVMLFQAEKSFTTGCMTLAKDEMDQFSCKMYSETYRREMKAALNMEEVPNLTWYQKIFN